MTKGRGAGDSKWAALRSLITPNPFQGLVFLAVILLMVAIFVFGERGKYRDPDIADILRTIAVGALAASVTAIIDRHMSTNELEKRIRDSFRESAGVATSLTELGVHTAHRKFDFGTVFREARRGETVSWLDTYCPRQNEFVDDLMAALRRGVKVRMLVIDPESENAHYRSQELERTTDTGVGWTAGLDAFIAKMQTIVTRDAGAFETRFYRDLPCVPMYLVGKAPHARKGYFSVFLVRATADCPHVELHEGEWLQDMAKHFEAKWARQPATLPASVAPTVEKVRS